MRPRLAGVVLGLLLGAGGGTGGQSSPPPEVQIRSWPYVPSAVFTAQSNLVEVDAQVFDHNGQPLAGLPESAFHITDNGRPQKITSFREERIAAAAAAPAAAVKAPSGTPAPAGPSAPPATVTAPSPRAIALLFDDLHVDPSDFPQLRLAAERYASTSVGAQDRLGILTASGLAESDFSSDRAAAQAALTKLRPHLHMRLTGMQECPRITPDQAYRILTDGGATPAYRTALAEAIQCNCVEQGNTAAGRAPPGGRGRGDCGDQQAFVVRALAQATWDQALEQSQLTLQAIGRALDALSAQPGRRVLVLASSGYLDGTLYRNESDLIQQAIGDDIVIDSLDAKGLVVSDIKDSELLSGAYRAIDPAKLGGGPPYDQGHVQELWDLTDSMALLAAGTGGRLFWNSNDLQGGFQSLTAPAAIEYELAFSPDPYIPDGHFHNLRVTVDDSNARNVEARRGYFAAEGNDADAQALAREALGSDTRHDIAVTARAALEPAANGANAVDVEIGIDTKSLALTRCGDRNCGELTFVTVLRAANGPPAAALAGREAVMTLRLTDASVVKYRQSGLHVSLTLAAPQGAQGNYEVREIVRESGTGHLGAVNTPIAGR